MYHFITVITERQNMRWGRATGGTYLNHITFKIIDGVPINEQSGSGARVCSTELEQRILNNFKEIAKSHTIKFI